MHENAPKDLSDCQRFFLEPASARHRQYEALRAYFVEQRPSREVARAFGYSPGAFQVLCHHFRREPDPLFFVTPKRGPREQPKKSAARDLIVVDSVDPRMAPTDHLRRTQRGFPRSPRAEAACRPGASLFAGPDKRASPASAGGPTGKTHFWPKFEQAGLRGTAVIPWNFRPPDIAAFRG